MATTTATTDPQTPSSQPQHDHGVVEITERAVVSVFSAFFSYIGELAILAGQAVKTLFRQGVAPGDLYNQMYAIGIGTLPISLLTVFSSSAVISLYFSQFLLRYGAGNLTGAVVALACGRELSPVLVGVVTAARSGSAIAAEIGTMEVTEQIAALKALAVSPIEYLVVPRILAAIIMVPLLAIVSDAFGLWGGYLVAIWMGVPGPSYGESIQQFVDMRDFSMGIVKTIVFAAIVALVSCHQGLRTKGGATGVGRATTNAVVLSIIIIYIFDFVLAYFMFGGKSGP